MKPLEDFYEYLNEDWKDVDAKKYEHIKHLDLEVIKSIIKDLNDIDKKYFKKIKYTPFWDSFDATKDILTEIANGLRVLKQGGIEVFKR